jgi:tetratricopeptide (TPR) repeat protein
MNFHFPLFHFFWSWILIPLILFSYSSCNGPGNSNAGQVKKDSVLYLNHSDSAKYVGMNTCRQCHQDIYNSFIKTGMGKSFDLATKTKSSGDFASSTIYDKIADLHYKAYWSGDSMFMKEFRIDKNDTVHQRTEQVSFVIGSGQHTNSHLQSVNGYIHQMPMTYYTQKKHWDLPPGFENGVNTRFSRKIGLECMTCHNSFPEFVMGSENKYQSVPSGIGCERCHGPGSVHVAERSTGSRIDTSKYIDYSIVNPGKLSPELQFDVCQRCHLQGNAVLKEGKSFFDFKPGQKLSDYISVFLPKYKNADDEFIMASHADRLKQSRCFIISQEKHASENTLRPSKNAMTCVTCHNPHVSVRETNENVFNDACMKCHSEDKKTVPEVHKDLSSKNISNCVSCHMPVSGATDIPHVSVHDHYIRKPVTKTEKDKIRTFMGLYSINEKDPDPLTKAKAYLDQYEKFDQKKEYLDSAENLLKKSGNLEKSSFALLQLFFIRQDYEQLLAFVRQLSENKAYDRLFTRKSFDNRDAWAAYRIAEAFSATGENTKALRWFDRAVALAPYNLDFRNKFGTALAGLNRLGEAVEQYDFIISENPRYAPVYANLGYVKLVLGFPAEAFRLYKIGKDLDPDNEALLLNLSGYYLFVKDRKNAIDYLNRILKRNPQNQKAKMILQQLNA